MKRALGVLVAGAVLCAASPAWAERLRVHEMAESPQYGQKVGGMLGRGVLNVATCFVDVLVHTVNETKSGPPLIGTLVGVAKGAGCGVLRATSGVVDVATFWVPGFNGFPVSDSYADCLAGPAPSAAMPESGPSMQTYGSEAPTGPAPSGAAAAGTTSHAARRWKK